MHYRIYKTSGRIGTTLEKNEMPFMEINDLSETPTGQTSLAVFDNETNTIRILNDKIIDVSSIVQKFKNHCNLPNNHQFSILHE
ncbi:MAG: hypothetical protein ACR2L1_03010 [Pyrinomonadaceae bacterium]